MKRECLLALLALSLAGCATTHMPATPLQRPIDPALLRPDLSEDVTSGIQSQELNSVIRGRR
jgi:hypothetical protein